MNNEIIKNKKDMKKLFKSMFMLAIAALAFTSCEDVPMPYDDPNNNGGGDGPGTVIEAAGDGTLENPFNVAGINEFIQAGVDLDKIVYIKGIVSATKEISPTFGNATFYISDDGTTSNQFYVYRCFGLNNAKITSEDEVKVGDEVIICGQVTNYNGTYETVQNSAYIYSINSQTSDNGGNTGEATGDGTQANPYNSVAANAVASALASGAESDYVYIKGKVVSIKENYDNNYGNATFYISDDGTSTGQFYVFRALYLNNEAYTAGDLLNTGDDVVIYTKLTNYMGNTPETVQGACYLYSLTSNGGGNTGGEVSGNSITVTASGFGLDYGTEAGTQTLSDGTTLSFDGGGNSNTPKYYTNGTNIRMYPKNSVTISSSKKIASVIINCDEASGTICNASGEISASPGSVNVNEKVVTVSGVNSTKTTITNTSSSTGTASQIRFVSMTINYAE